MRTGRELAVQVRRFTGLAGAPRRVTPALYGFVLPALILLAGVGLYPVLSTIWMSLHRITLTMPQLGRPFVGLDNFRTILGDPRFRGALSHTLFFAAVSVSLELVLGLGLALLIHREFAGRGLVRSVVLVPWAVPTIVSALMWRWMYHPQLGVINDLLRRLRLIDRWWPWLGEVSTALWSVIIADVWKTTPFMALLVLGGLQTIPSAVEEAALVDGATGVRKFFRITLPLLKPSILVAVLFRTIDALKLFDILFILTGGGPGNSTESLSLYAYNMLFNNLEFGYASALAGVAFAMSLTLAFLYIRVLGHRMTAGSGE